MSNLYGESTRSTAVSENVSFSKKVSHWLFEDNYHEEFESFISGKINAPGHLNSRYGLMPSTYNMIAQKNGLAGLLSLSHYSIGITNKFYVGFNPLLLIVNNNTRESDTDFTKEKTVRTFSSSFGAKLINTEKYSLSLGYHRYFKNETTKIIYSGEETSSSTLSFSEWSLTSLTPIYDNFAISGTAIHTRYDSPWYLAKVYGEQMSYIIEGYYDYSIHSQFSIGIGSVASVEALAYELKSISVFELFYNQDKKWSEVGDRSREYIVAGSYTYKDKVWFADKVQVGLIRTMSFNQIAPSISIWF